MGVDEEYKMITAEDDANDHLLERAGQISRSSYRKRNMFASILVGAVIGAAVTFLISLIFAPAGYSVTKSADHQPEKQLQPVSVTVTATTTQIQTQTRTVKVIGTGAASNVDTVTSGKKHQEGVDEAHLIPSGTMLDCGHSPSEARAKGCIFDVMMQDWMPKPCYDQTLSERYLLNGNWSWWANAEATEFLSLEQMRKGEHDVIYVIQDYHKSHCIFAWEKMVRAVRNDWPLIEELISYDHVMHCRHSTLSKEAEGIRGVRAPTAYVRCALVEDWYGRFPGNSVSSVDKRWVVERDVEKRWEVVDMPNARH